MHFQIQILRGRTPQMYSRSFGRYLHRRGDQKVSQLDTLSNKLIFCIVDSNATAIHQRL